MNVKAKILEELKKHFPVNAIEDGDVKDRHSFCFGVLGRVYTVFFDKDYYQKTKDIAFKVNFLGIINDISKEIKRARD
jgi:hypothetical protein